MVIANIFWSYFKKESNFYLNCLHWGLSQHLGLNRLVDCFSFLTEFRAEDSLQNMNLRPPWWLKGKEFCLPMQEIVSIPGPRRSLLPQNSQVHVQQPLSLCSKARELKLLKSSHPRACASQHEKPPKWEASTFQRQKKVPAAMETQHGQK